MQHRSIVAAKVQPIALTYQHGLAYIAFALLALCCVLYIDTSLASWLHVNSQPNVVLKAFSSTPIALELLAATVILLSIRPKFRPLLASLRNTLIATLVLATLVRVSTKCLFGRTWPETWTNDNLSWITDGIMTFEPLTPSSSFHSFPSGHALFAVALACVFWRFIPQLKGLWLTAIALTIIGQLGQNYHYLGDLIAGVTFGVMVSHVCINACNGTNTNRNK